MIKSLSCFNLIDCFLITSLLSNLVLADINWNGNNWAMGCDFRGNDLSNVRSSGEVCSQKCAETNGCTHYAWNKWRSGTCWLKYGSVSKKNAFSSSDGNMVCGVLSEDTNQMPSETPSKHFLVLTILNSIILENLISSDKDNTFSK